jgi:hypothetical protein
MTLTDGAALAGPAIRIHLPAHGTYYLSIQPSSRYTFQPDGHVERNRLTISTGSERVEITARTNILKHSEYGTVWVYFEAGQDRKYLNLDRQVRRLKLALAGLQVQFTPQHPDLRSTEAALNVLQRRQDDLARMASLAAAGSVDSLFAPSSTSH